MSTSSLETKIQGLLDRLYQENQSSQNDVAKNIMEKKTTRHRPPLDLSSTSNNRRPQLNLPVSFQQRNVESETDNKLREIMKISGLLTINGRKYETKISDMEHISVLGTGTCGVVVKMKHLPSGEIIAVKQMRRSGNSEENKRIIMDIDVVLKSHDCPYIVQCLGCFITESDVWICMELMATCFDKLLKNLRTAIPENVLGKVTYATVKALSYLKEQHDVIHRDVKPSNILVDERGNVKLCDFGISGRLVDSMAKTRSAGCAAYMAPERIEPPNPLKPDYDIRADVWSLGITLVELATGIFPYKDCKTDFEVLTKVLSEDPPTLPDTQEFSHEFRAFVACCLIKNFVDRPKYVQLLNHPFMKIHSQAEALSGGNAHVNVWLQGALRHADSSSGSGGSPARRYVAAPPSTLNASANSHQMQTSQNQQQKINNDSIYSKKQEFFSNSESNDRFKCQNQTGTDFTKDKCLNQKKFDRSICKNCPFKQEFGDTLLDLGNTKNYRNPNINYEFNDSKNPTSYKNPNDSNFKFDAPKADKKHLNFDFKDLTKCESRDKNSDFNAKSNFDFRDSKNPFLEFNSTDSNPNLDSNYDSREFRNPNFEFRNTNFDSNPRNPNFDSQKSNLESEFQYPSFELDLDSNKKPLNFEKHKFLLEKNPDNVKTLSNKFNELDLNAMSSERQQQQQQNRVEFKVGYDNESCLTFNPSLAFGGELNRSRDLNPSPTSINSEEISCSSYKSLPIEIGLKDNLKHNKYRPNSPVIGYGYGHQKRNPDTRSLNGLTPNYGNYQQKFGSNLGIPNTMKSGINLGSCSLGSNTNSFRESQHPSSLGSNLGSIGALGSGANSGLPIDSNSGICSFRPIPNQNSYDRQNQTNAGFGVQMTSQFSNRNQNVGSYGHSMGSQGPLGSNLDQYSIRSINSNLGSIGTTTNSRAQMGSQSHLGSQLGTVSHGPGSLGSNVSYTHSNSYGQMGSQTQNPYGSHLGSLGPNSSSFENQMGSQGPNLGSHGVLMSSHGIQMGSHVPNSQGYHSGSYGIQMGSVPQGPHSGSYGLNSASGIQMCSNLPTVSKWGASPVPSRKAGISEAQLTQLNNTSPILLQRFFHQQKQLQNNPMEVSSESNPDGNCGGLRRRFASHVKLQLGTQVGVRSRHQSPEPPPRLSRGNSSDFGQGQSPTPLRRHFLEANTSPSLSRRYLSGIPQPPPRGRAENSCSSVPGSPRNLRARMHYTPEPQRRILYNNSHTSNEFT